MTEDHGKGDKLRRAFGWREALAVALGLALLIIAWTGVIDQRAESQYETMLTRALVTFALARSLNGVISVVQETEVALQPAGVGVGLAPGQILDPVNDLVERFSWVMLASAASLATQRLLMEISEWPGMKLILAACVLFWWSGLVRPESSMWRRAGRRAFLVAVFLRFGVPAVILATELVFTAFLDPVFSTAKAEIEQTSEQLSTLRDQDAQSTLEEQEQASGLGGWWRQASGSLRVGERIAAYQALFSRLAENVVQLIAVFVLKTVLLPLAFLWLLLRLWKNLWRPM